MNHEEMLTQICRELDRMRADCEEHHKKRTKKEISNTEEWTLKLMRESDAIHTIICLVDDFDEVY